MKNLLITLLFITPSLNLLAQEPMVFDYDWEKNPTLHQLSEADQKIPELVLKDKIVVEFAYNGKGELEAYKLHHVIIRVNSDDAINENNKIYLPYFNSSDMISQKARVINSKGKVINLDEDDIKESQDEESESSYKYFAVEGIDLGSEIEYYFVLRSSPNYSGNQITVQGTAPKRNVEFTLITPENLVMATKSYNNMPEPELDPTNKEQNVLTVLMDTVAGLKREEFANWDANLMYIVYKLDKNTYNNKRDLTNYGNYSELVYASIYEEPASAAMKKLKSLIKENGFNAITDEEEKIRAVEDSIKTSIRIFDLYVDQLSDLESILKDKVANDIGMLKLFTQLYTLLGIQHEIVVTCSRYDAKFDPDFESYNYLEIYLLYFPGTGKYMYPGGQFSRLGYIDYDYTHNYGLFIKEVEVGDYKSGVGKIKFIDALSHDVSKDDLYVEVDLNEDITNPVYKIHREQTGYYAQGNQIVYNMVDADVQKDIREEQITFISEDAEIKEVKLKNTNASDFGKEPLITDGTFTTPQFVEKAGTKYLFNVGLLIGPQAEMYQEEERKLEVENDFNRWYHRELTFTIPDGYQCTNLNDLQMDVFQEKDGKRTMTFTSNYTVTGNKVKVVIDEYYSQIIWPLEEFEQYRSVINAAADFNKISLVLEPK